MHQYLFFIGDFPIRMYGLIMCASIFLGTGVAYYLAKQDGRWHQYILDIGIYGGFAGLIGGRLWDVFFFDWAYYKDHLLEIPYVWQGGMAVQGGMLAGFLAGVAYCIYHKVDWVALADIICPSMILAQAIGRMANLLKRRRLRHAYRRQFRPALSGRHPGPLRVRQPASLARRSLGRPAGCRSLCGTPDF
jgi:phosphatidylglycerol:prolipoprotein diacylglycerol transferase